jgi:hypothetical protein
MLALSRSVASMPAAAQNPAGDRLDGKVYHARRHIGMNISHPIMIISSNVAIVRCIHINTS